MGQGNPLSCVVSGVSAEPIDIARTLPRCGKRASDHRLGQYYTEAPKRFVDTTVGGNGSDQLTCCQDTLLCQKLTNHRFEFGNGRT